MRVSNRVNKCAMTLKTYPTVYNDLVGEVSISLEVENSNGVHPPVLFKIFYIVLIRCGGWGKESHVPPGA